jgi:hypothetical protein
MISSRRLAPLGTAQAVAVGGSALAALLYALIGLGVLAIGRPADGSAGDLVGFGVTLAGTFALSALLLARIRSRAFLFAIVALQVIVLVGYFAFAYLREPPIELWGVVIKVCQAVVLLAVGWMLVNGSRRTVR